MKKLIAGLMGLTAIACLAGQLTYSTAQVENSVRLSLEPGHLAAQLYEVSSPITTAYSTATFPTNLQGALSLELKASQDFTFDTNNVRFFYSKAGATNVPFNVTASLSFSQTIGTPDAEVTVRATKNGTAIEGVYFKRTIRTSNTVGVGSLTGHFTLTENDYVEISVESEKDGDFFSWAFSTDIIEEAQ